MRTALLLVGLLLLLPATTHALDAAPALAPAPADPTPSPSDDGTCYVLWHEGSVGKLVQYRYFTVECGA